MSFTPTPRSQAHSAMPAFTPSLPIPRSSASSSRCTKCPHVQRRTRPSLSIAPLRERNNIKNRSIIALRGLSDLGGVTILHELAARVALPTTLTSFAEADTQLLLGGLIGVWTAAGLAERLRQETLGRIRESREIGDRWDAAFVYSPDIVDDEVVDAVGWLYAFEELEGAQASELLNNVATNGSVGMRVGLADALGTVGVASNVVDSVLTGLTNDDEVRVRNSAQDALTRYHGIGERYGMIDETIAKNRVLDMISEHVEAMGNVALSKPDLRQLTGVEEVEEEQVIDVQGFNEKVEVPLFEGLRLSELHGLCALALIPAGYELLSMADGANLPLRFVGLGWLLTMGGLAAYPQSALRQAEQLPSQTLLYLGLGALLGVIYSLGTEKFIRAMHHRHIFVRNAMLWLAAVTWLLAVAVLIWVAANIYNQTNGGLEGFDRVLGVTIPFVVRADLVVDWAKRVSWALLNMLNWTQSSVQVRRLISRAPSMQLVVSIDDDVRTMIRNSQDRQRDLLASEDRVWTEDADALVRVSEIIQHFEKLGRVACYACACLILATPSALVWIVYAIINGIVSLTRSQFVVAALYFISVFLAPVGALIMILASTGLLCGVVTLSVVGTAIQFAVYWSTRTVYSMVRIALSQAWAGFPHLKKPHAMPNVPQSPPGPNAGTMAVRAVRHPEEAGAAMACMGNLLPSELEFSLGSWDGTHKGHTFKPIGSSLSRHLMSFGNWFHNHIHTPHFQHGHLNHSHMAYASKTCQTLKKRRSNGDSPADSDNLNTSGDTSTSGRDENGQGDIECAKTSTEDITPPEPVSAAEEESRRVIKDNEKILILLGRLGLDLRIKSPRRRRLSTYYALAMLVHLQVESGGNAWRLHDTKEVTESDFEERIRNMNCVVADEAKIAIEELSHRLRGSSKYRIIPTGYPSNRMIAVQLWLRLTLLSFLETPSDSDIKITRAASVT